MSKKAFDKIAEGLKETLAIARGEAVPLVPNAKTIAAMEEARKGGLKRFNTIGELMADLNEGDAGVTAESYLDKRLSKSFVDRINACEDLAFLRWEAKNGQACARDLANFSEELLAALRPFADGTATAEHFAKAAEIVKRSDDLRKLGEKPE